MPPRLPPSILPWLRPRSLARAALPLRLLRQLPLAQLAHRSLSTSRPARAGPTNFGGAPQREAQPDDIDIQTYHRLSDQVMDSLTEILEELLEEGGWEGDLACEVEYSSAVLTLNMGSEGIYVINKQPPNKQIWLSSPKSGPKRYDYSPKLHTWVNNRDGSTLESLLDAELGAITGKEVRVGQGWVDEES